MVKKIFSFVLVLVTLVMSVFTCVNGYYVLWGKNKLPSAVTSTFATTVTNPETGEEMPVIEANYYDNINNSGYSVVELLFESHPDRTNINNITIKIYFFIFPPTPSNFPLCNILSSIRIV